MIDTRSPDSFEWRFVLVALGILALGVISIYSVSPSTTPKGQTPLYAKQLTWILIGLTGFILVAALAVAVYTPTLTRQIKALNTDGASSPAYKALANRAQAVGMFIVVVVIGIVFVMVFKPLA